MYFRDEGDFSACGINKLLEIAPAKFFRALNQPIHYRPISSVVGVYDDSNNLVPELFESDLVDELVTEHPNSKVVINYFDPIDWVNPAEVNLKYDQSEFEILFLERILQANLNQMLCTRGVSTFKEYVCRFMPEITNEYIANNQTKTVKNLNYQLFQLSILHGDLLHPDTRILNIMHVDVNEWLKKYRGKSSTLRAFLNLAVSHYADLEMVSNCGGQRDFRVGLIPQFYYMVSEDGFKKLGAYGLQNRSLDGVETFFLR